MKIVTIVGARPQFIKAGIVTLAIKKYNKNFYHKKSIQEILVHTGQHYDYLLNQIFFDELGLPKPHYHLGVGSGSHGWQTGIMLERIEKVLQKEGPERVIVYGDTNSTLAGALASAKLNIPIGHVEAGLRSYDRKMPEEVNRLLTDHLSTYLFCPTKQAVHNLAQEGIKNGNERVVKNVGDVMYDSILFYDQLAEKKSTILKDLNLLTFHPRRKQSQPVPYYLATIHRAENTDDPKRLQSILRALNEIGREVPVILPLHPRTQKMIATYQLHKETKHIRIIKPVSYLNMLMLEKKAKLILTDSGGVQKEAYWFGVPCVTLREETEWVETVQSGWNILVGANTEKIIKGVSQICKRKSHRASSEAFGDGKACEKIINLLLKK